MLVDLLPFTLLGWTYMLTFEFLCSGIDFYTSCLVTFWFPGGQLLRPLVLFAYVTSLGNICKRHIMLSLSIAHSLSCLITNYGSNLRKPENYCTIVCSTSKVNLYHLVTLCMEYSSLPLSFVHLNWKTCKISRITGLVVLLCMHIVKALT